MTQATENGGFPAPPTSEPVRVLAARHADCRSETRVRVPRTLPSRAVRRVVCEHCRQPFSASDVEDRGIEGQAVAVPASAPGGERGASSRLRGTLARPDWWRWLSLPVAALAVLAVLSALRGEQPTSSSAPSAEAPAAIPAADVPRDAQLISESTFQLALPAGWERVPASGGATFAASAPDGAADATLWVERDPELDFATFEARSLAQLESLAGSARVVERTPGPTPEATSVRIAPADPPAGAPDYEVMLRSAGDQWYYLATMRQPDTGARVAAGVELVQGSFLPQDGGS